MENKKEEIKKEEIKKEEIKIDNQIVETEKAEAPRVLKGFTIEKSTTASGRVMAKLIVETLMGSTASVYLNESHLAVIDLVGLDKCYVNIEERYSQEKKKKYHAIALHADEEVMDFFVKDRAFTTLALLQAKKVQEQAK